MRSLETNRLYSGSLGVPQNHLIDRALLEFLRLDQVFLGGSKQVVQESHI